MNLSRTRLLGLSRKYRVLSALRRGVLAPKETLRPLAREFPGALRELDCLPLAELEARLRAVTAAEQGAVPEPWIAWMLCYHERMRVVLEVKQRLRGARPSDRAIVDEVASELARTSHTPADVGFVAQVSAPPGGRLNRLVFELLERELGCPRAKLEQTLFPRLRRD
jgi:hypothetical protein